MAAVNIPVQLPDGSQIWIESTPVGNDTQGDIAATDAISVPLSLGQLGDSISAICKVVKDSITVAAPKSASVEFGVEVAIDSGKLTALLVKGSAKGTLKVTLSW